MNKRQGKYFEFLILYLNFYRETDLFRGNKLRRHLGLEENSILTSQALT